MDDKRQFTPNIKLVAIEETGHWADEIAAVVGRVFGIYAYDERICTHLCSITPSYWLWFVENVFEKHFEDESPELQQIDVQSMTDLMYENGGERGGYYDCHDIDRIPDHLKIELGACGFELGAHDDLDDYEKRCDDLVGELCSNGISLDPFTIRVPEPA